MQINKSKHLIVQADCIPVKGYKRSCIYDLTRRKYYFIPNSLVEILLNYNYLPIAKIYDEYDNNPVLDEYFEFLIAKEIIYQSEEWEIEHFPKIDLVWKHPSKIVNLLIDMDGSLSIDSSKFKRVLDELGVKHIQIRQAQNDRIDVIQQFLSNLIDTRLKSIELILHYTNEYIPLSNLLKKCNPKILLIYFYASPFTKTIAELNQPRLIFITDEADALLNEKSPSPKYFAVNIQSYTEAQKHHIFFNRKIFIDTNWQIKNSLFGTKTFGHIDNVDIHSVIESKEFQEFWFVEKDNTVVCKDCEFRYLCTDQRTPKKIKDGWGHYKPCRYNPYQAKWEWEKGFESPKAE